MGACSSSEGATSRLQKKSKVEQAVPESPPSSPAWTGVETGKRQCVADYEIVHGEPDEMGRTERWRCRACGHLSPGNLDGFGWSSCQSCGTRPGEVELEDEEEQQQAATHINAAFEGSDDAPEIVG